MTDEEARDIMIAAVSGVTADGFIVTGEITIMRPRTPGLVKNEMRIRPMGPITLVELKTIKVKGPASLVLEPTIINEACINCGSTRLQQAGACKVCLDCGTAGGCG